MENNQAGWTFETLRIHLLAIMDERKESQREAVATALKAVEKSHTVGLAMAAALATVISALIAGGALVFASHH